jgi:hypothetical protein
VSGHSFDESSRGKPKGETNVRPIRGRYANCGYEVTGGYFNVMARLDIDKILPRPKLDALTAEKVFGWQNVHKHQGALVGKKQDKAGHWRRAKVPNYSTNPLHSYSVENRMKPLGRSDRYQNELSKITRSKNLPSDWASPDQRCRAAIQAVGRYGQVIAFNKSRKQNQK